LTEEQKFQIARRVVIATQQWITYAQFLPSAGQPRPAPRVRRNTGAEGSTGAGGQVWSATKDAAQARALFQFRASSLVDQDWMSST
jgi:hypothetical protein